MTYALDPADGIFTTRLLQDDRFEGWLALASFDATGLSDIVEPGDHSTAAKILANAGIDPNVAATKMKTAAGVVEWYNAWVGAKDLEKAPMVAALLRGRPEFAPVEAFCRATCPGTAPACEAAWLFLSSPYEVESNSYVPEVALMSTDTFFATPRGARLIFPPATIGSYAKAGVLEKFLAPAARLDSCLAKAARNSATPTSTTP